MAILKADFRGQDLSRKKFYSTDFSEQDLKNMKMRQSTFHRCSFDGADLTEAECEGSEFLGSTFRNTNCYRTYFKDAKLGATVFQPKDCFGITITLQCATFTNMKISTLWWMTWIMFASMMKPGNSVVEEEALQNQLIRAVGSDQYIRLRTLLGKREV
jgi:hypothetical protein